MQRRFTGYSQYKRRSQRGTLGVSLMLLTLALIGGAGYFANTDSGSSETQAVVSASDTSADALAVKSDLDQTLELRDANGGAMQARFTQKISRGHSSFSVIGELPKAEKGYTYEVWAEQSDPYRFMSLGKMVERTDAKYGLVFESNEDLRDFSDIIITLEKNDGDPAPGASVLKGKF